MRQALPALLFLAAIAPAQTPEGSLSGLIKADLAAIHEKPTLSQWWRAHAGEGSIEPSYALAEYETQNLWCAASEASITLANGIHVTRRALFYEPLITGALPAKQDKTLVNQCRLLAIWYEVNRAPSLADFADAAVQELSVRWGTPDRAGRFSRLRQGWGWGNWEPFYYWEHDADRVVVAVDPKGPIEGPFARLPRAMAVVRSSELPTAYVPDLGAGFAPRGQPRPNEQMARLEKFCSFEGRTDWRDGLIAFGEQLLRENSASAFTPWIHLILARAFNAKLQLALPSGDITASPSDGPLDPAKLRGSAISHFRAFLALRPNDPDAPYARREAWRLLAGLPPSPIRFGCNND